MSLHEFLEASNLPATEVVRSTWESFFSQYPQVRRDHLASRIRSDDQHHIGAIFELFLYVLLQKLDFNVAVQESPDFLVESPAGERFYLEACCVFPDMTLHSPDVVKREIADEINRSIRSDHVMIFVRFSGAVDRRPSCVRVVADVKKLIDVWDQDVQTGRPFGPPKGSLRYADLHLSVEPRPKPKAESTSSPVVMPLWAPNEAELCIADLRIRKSLKDKANKYKQLAHPLVIAANVVGPRVDEEMIFEVLFGKEKVDVKLVASEIVSAEPGREDEGFWHSHNRQINSRVPVVIVFRNLGSLDIGGEPPLAFFNPYLPCSKSLSDVAVFDRFVYDSSAGCMTKRCGDSYMKLLGLWHRWPSTGG
jgi:hypothetical protein